MVGRISEKEIKHAVWCCDCDKSPRPGGFNFGCIKFCWEVLKVDVFRVVCDTEKGGWWPRGTNALFISLIPKVYNPQKLKDFRPISLVGCLYKIVTEIFSLRLKNVLHKVINGRQFAFLEGRGLMDNVLVQNKSWKKWRGERQVVCFSKLTMKRLMTRSSGTSSITC